MKTCTKCKVPKTVDLFNTRVAGKDGIDSRCKACALEYLRGWRKENRDTINKKRRKERLQNPEKQNEYHREWRKINGNGEREQKASRDKRARNPEKVRKTAREKRKARYHADKNFRLAICLRSRLQIALNRANAKKTVDTMELIGCPWVWAEVHLESLFKPGMSWENHGPVWHIDHIRPCASFDLTNPEQQKMCFHWTNLQPLFAKENLEKGDFYDSGN